MDDTRALASHRPARPGTIRWYHKLTASRRLVATWSERLRLRWELERMAKDNPHLVDDIGLTKRQVEAEIAKPFWRR